MSNREQVTDYIISECKKVKFTPEGIAALLAQLEKESQFQVNNVENAKGWSDEAYTQAVKNGTYTNFANDRIGYGLFQVTEPSRKQSFLDFTSLRKSSIDDLENQTAFMLWELYKKFPTIWAQLCTSHDLEGLVHVLLYQWENPQEKVKNMQERLGYARQWLAKLNASSHQSQTSSQINPSVQPATKEAAVQRVLEIARSEIDYREKGSNTGLDDKNANAGSGNYTKYARDLDAIPNFYNGKKQGYAYCDVFNDWLFVKAFGADTAMKMLCQPQNSAGAGCAYSKQYYQAAGRFTKTPEPGAQIFFWDNAGQINHTGIVESVNGGQVTTIEGNTSDRVARRVYSISDGTIAGYGIPVWELAIAQMATQAVQTTTSPVNVNIDMNIVNNMYLRLGDKNDQVAMMQQRLKDLGYDIGPDGVDGEFGDDTLAALKQFQLDHKLMECGYFGPATYQAMKPDTTSQPVQIPTVQTPKEFKIGDFVNFVGVRQYTNPYNDNGRDAKPGKARIVTIRKDAKHPYYLSHATNGGSDVLGWVDAADVEDM